MTSQKRSDDLPPDLTDVFEYKDLQDFTFNQKETENLVELARIVLEKQNKTFNVAISRQGHSILAYFTSLISKHPFLICFLNTEDMEFFPLPLLQCQKDH